MAGQRIALPNGEAATEGYLAIPELGKGPGIIVLQEWWGLVPHIEDICDRFAAEGFTALAPDLYQGESTTEPSDAATLMQALNIDVTETILRKTILTMLAHPAVTSEKMGVVGFCMGGQLAILAATLNPTIGACVNFYGIHPKVQPVLRDLECPVLGFFAERDNSASPSVVKALDQELSLLNKPHEFITYPGTDHAFFNDTRPTVYNAEAAKDSWGKMLAFFRANL
jgi:carboxymethylenebutenolidase